MLSSYVFYEGLSFTLRKLRFESGSARDEVPSSPEKELTRTLSILALS